MPGVTDDENFDKRWLHETTQEHELSINLQNLNAVKEFAYSSFDRIDKDGNGFLDTEELTALLVGDQLSTREKSFIQFLLNNREQISEMSSEQDAPADAISRRDIELYFQLLSSLL